MEIPPGGYCGGVTRQNISIGKGPTQSVGCGCGCGHESESATGIGTTSEASAPTVYEVAGMTCGHCAGAVTEALRRIPGVEDVTVELVPGGASTVAVVSSGPVGEDDVRAAIDEAGYELTGVKA